MGRHSVGADEPDATSPGGFRRVDPAGHGASGPQWAGPTPPPTAASDQTDIDTRTRPRSTAADDAPTLRRGELPPRYPPPTSPPPPTVRPQGAVPPQAAVPPPPYAVGAAAGPVGPAAGPELVPWEPVYTPAAPPALPPPAAGPPRAAPAPPYWPTVPTGGASGLARGLRAELDPRRSVPGGPQYWAGADTRERPVPAVPAGRSVSRALASWVVVLVVAVLAALALRAFVVESFWIPSASMEPTLHGCAGCNNDRVLVNKTSYRLHAVHRGDVVVFDKPAAVEDPDKYLIKRVIGLPGDVVSGHDGAVWIGNRPLAEPYVNPACGQQASFAAIVVPAGQILVLGDNRCNSFDGRMFGPIAEETILGRAFVIIWPVSRRHWL